MAPEPLFGHIGHEISKNRKRKYTGLQRGMKLSLAANLMLNWVCSVLSFPERFQPITTAAMCTIAINLLEPGAFNAESQYFIPLFNKFHDFADNTGPVLRLNARWKPRWFSLSGSHWEPYWKPMLVFSRRVRKAQHWLHLLRRGRNSATIRQKKKNTGLQGRPPQPPPDRIFSFWAIFCISQRGNQGFRTVQDVD